MMIRRHRWMVTLLVMMGFAIALPAAAEFGQDAPQAVPIEFTNGAATLRGSLVIPDGDGPFPALVFVHGSGDGPRSDFRIFAEQFARAGIASLIYDKRGSGDSTGSWVTSSLSDLAGDVVAAVTAAASHRLTDEDRIGLWAISQGGWVASVACSMTDDVAFALVVTGGGVRPRDSELYAYRNRLTAAGIPPGNQADALAVIEQYFEYLGSGVGRAALEARLEAARGEAWHDVLSLDRVLPSEQEREAWSWVATFDPLPYIARMRIPALVLLGAHDDLTPLDLTRRAWTAGLERAGNDDFTIQVFPEAGHGITVGGHDVAHGAARTYADGYFETMTTWLTRQVEP